jgi:hypothetical protein
MLVAFVPDAPPVIPPVTVGDNQLYVVPEGTTPFVPFTGVELKDVPLHAVLVSAGIEGAGLTVTVTVNGEPAQVPDVGVTV